MGSLGALPSGVSDSAGPQTPWAIINTHLRFHSPDTQFWWSTTGRMLATLLRHAGYSTPAQYHELFFYALWIAPELGLAPDAAGRPRGWPSNWAPGGTPIEFSFDFGTAGGAAAAPTMVRYSFEIVGRAAGSPADPLNSRAADDWIERVRQQEQVPGLDLEWYRHFTKHLLPPPDMQRVKTGGERLIEATTPKAGTGMAIDVEERCRGGPVMKVYVYPGLRALELGVSNLEMVERAVRALPEEQFRALMVEPLLEYLWEAKGRWRMETGIVCIDCLEPGEARIKIYVRAPNTTVEYLMDALTLGGRMDLEGYDEAVKDMVDLWRAFLADGPDVVPEDAPARANPGFYFTVGRGKPASPKMYLSPGYFVKNDLEVINRLRGWFSTRRRKNLEVVDKYEKALKEIYGNLLEKDCGSHFYVGAAMTKTDGLRVVTYLDPQIIGRENLAL